MTPTHQTSDLHGFFRSPKDFCDMIILLAAIGGTLAGIAFGFIGVLALLEHFKWKTWLAVTTAAILSLPIGVVVGGVAAAVLIFIMYPDFDWKF